MLGKYSISTKLTWMNLFVSGAALLLASLVLLAYDQVTARANLVDSLRTQAQIIGANSVSAILFNDPQSAQGTLAALKSSPNIEGSGLFTPDGRPFAEYWQVPENRVTVIPHLSPGQAEVHVFTANQVRMVRSIEFQGKTVGTIYLISDLAQIEARRNRFLRILAAVLLVAMIAALIASTVFRRTVAKPIVDLAATARTVALERNYALRATPSGDRDELATLIGAFNEMLSQIQERDAALSNARDDLEKRVDERTKQLVAVNRELEAFSYSVSHDLRGPLEIISGMSYILLQEYGRQLDSNGKDSLERIQAAARRMAQLIEDLLNLARVTKTEMHRESVDLSAMGHAIASELKRREPQRQAEIVIAEGMYTLGDSRLLCIVLENLIGNAWKYTSQKPFANIEFGVSSENENSSFYIKDNGAGFDPQAGKRLFQPFQRLHSISEFPGTGVGLAIVQRIIQKHGGSIWAEAVIGEGATFYFDLPVVLDPKAATLMG